MEVRYNPTVLAPSVANEILCFMALTGLHNLHNNGIISTKNLNKAAVGIAQRFGVSAYKV